jgi:hypothetical protein
MNFLNNARQAASVIGTQATKAVKDIGSQVQPGIKGEVDKATKSGSLKPGVAIKTTYDTGKLMARKKTTELAVDAEIAAGTSDNNMHSLIKLKHLLKKLNNYGTMDIKTLEKISNMTLSLLVDPTNDKLSIDKLPIKEAMENTITAIESKIKEKTALLTPEQVRVLNIKQDYASDSVQGDQTGGKRNKPKTHNKTHKPKKHKPKKHKPKKHNKTHKNKSHKLKK